MNWLLNTKSVQRSCAMIITIRSFCVVIIIMSSIVSWTNDKTEWHSTGLQSSQGIFFIATDAICFEIVLNCLTSPEKHRYSNETRTLSNIFSLQGVHLIC